MLSVLRKLGLEKFLLRKDNGQQTPVFTPHWVFEGCEPQEAMKASGGQFWRPQLSFLIDFKCAKLIYREVD